MSGTLEKVVAYMTHYEYNIPVLQETYDKFKQMFEEDGFDVEVEDLDKLIMNDPYLALKVILKVSHLKKTNLHADVDSIKKAILLLGTKNILSLVLSSTVMIQNDWINLAIKRAVFAANISRKFSEIRYDIRPSEVALSTLLADLGELMIWTFKPQLALAVTQKMMTRECVRNYQAQLAVFGFKYGELSYNLAKAWRLPEPIINFLEHKEREHIRERLSHVCVDVARHVYGIDGYKEIPGDIEKLKETMETKDNNEILDVLRLWTILPEDQNNYIINQINKPHQEDISSQA